METIALFAILLFLLYILVQAAKLVEGTFVLIAKNVKINEFFMGFVILSIITSLPEISIAVVSSQDVPQLSVGNMIGASAILMTLVIGISAIRYKKVEFKGKFAEKEVVIGLVSVFLMLLSMADRYISVVEGIFLIAYYFLYVTYLNHKFNKKNKAKDLMVNAKKIYNTLGKAAFGALLIIVSSTLIVRTAESLAFNLQVSPSLIGLILLSLGTNIPELTISLTSKLKKSEEALTVGNVIGSLSLNPGTVGLLAILAQGVYISDFIAIIPAIVICGFSTALFLFFSWSGKVITRTEGYLLLGAYFSLILSEAIILIGNSPIL